MGTESAQTTTAPKNGAAAPPALKTPEARVRADRSNVLNEFLGGAADKGEGDKPADDARVEAKTEDAGDAPSDETDDDAAAAGDEKPDDKKPAGEDKPDAETAKRLAAVQKAEQRSREKIATERKQWETQRDAERKEIDDARRDLEAVKGEVSKWRKAVARAKVDPLAVLEAAGVEDFEYAAKQAYARHKGDKGDPNSREAAARLLRERESDDRVTSLEKKLEAYEKRDKEREQQAHVERETTRIMDGYVKAAGADDAPALVRHAMSKNAAATRQRLQQTAFEINAETGEIPDAADVFARYEKVRRAELEELGVDIDSIIKAGVAPATTQKKNEPAAEKKNPAKTLSNDLTAPRAPRSRSDAQAERRDVLAALESGKLD